MCFRRRKKRKKSKRRLLTLDGAAKKTCCPCFPSPHPASPHVRGCPRPHVTRAARASNPSSRAQTSAPGVPPNTSPPHRACPRRRTRRHSALHRALYYCRPGAHASRAARLIPFFACRAVRIAFFLSRDGRARVLSLAEPAVSGCSGERKEEGESERRHKEEGAHSSAANPFRRLDGFFFSAHSQPAPTPFPTPATRSSSKTASRKPPPRSTASPCPSTRPAPTQTGWSLIICIW